MTDTAALWQSALSLLQDIREIRSRLDAETFVLSDYDLLIGKIRFRNECMELARLCVEQDPATAEWVFDMAKGRVSSVAYTGAAEDGVDDSLFREWMSLEVKNLDNTIKTNKYLVWYVAREHGVVVSNFNSRARATVEALWKKVR